uniref:ATP synthase subunit 8 n=1 Tax=Bothriocroton hydrosauri TaxID=59643 RepID=UPI0030FF0E83
MPQLFPMNWLLISLLISMSIFIMIINTFFFQLISNPTPNKNNNNNNNNNKMSFKW